MSKKSPIYLGKKDEHIHIRVSKRQKALIKKRARIRGLSVSEYLIWRGAGE